jgi:DNA replication protein DnaC
MKKRGRFESELEKPADKEILCGWCGEKMTVTHHWIPVLNHWTHAAIHVRCQDEYYRQASQKSHKSQEREIPERFIRFDPTLADSSALDACAAFTPDSKLRTLVLVGVPRRGKSRIMWATIAQFFDLLELQTGVRRWVDYYLFADLVSELDRGQLNRLKVAKYAFLDDVGSVESYGRERAALQQVIRARIQSNRDWFFLTIDSLNFDLGLQDFLKGRATTHYIDK